MPEATKPETANGGRVALNGPVRRIGYYGMQEGHSKYHCYESAVCTAGSTWDDWHCNGCKHQGTRPNDA